MKRKVREVITFETYLYRNNGRLDIAHFIPMFTGFKEKDSVRVTVERIEPKRTPKEK